MQCSLLHLYHLVYLICCRLAEEPDEADLDADDIELLHYSRMHPDRPYGCVYDFLLLRVVATVAVILLS